MRKLVSSGSPFEPRIGFSRAVRIGEIVAVAGTAPIALDGSIVSPGNVYEQTKHCLKLVLHAVSEAGLSAESVIRTRVMLTDVTRWEEAARAHEEVFGGIRPACTFVQVVRFINPGWLVEIEADCVSDHESNAG